MLRDPLDRNPEEPVSRFRKNFIQKGPRHKMAIDSELFRKSRKERRTSKEWNLSSTMMKKEDLMEASRMLRWDSKTLHKVDLRFSRYDGGKINGDLKEMGRALKRAVGLKEVSVSFSSFTEITDEEVKILVEVLKKLKGLQMLTIKLSGVNEVTDQGISKLARCLRRLCLLKGLVLRLASMKKIGDKAIESIMKGTKRLPQFQDLDLDLFNIEITDKGFEVLQRGLGSDLRSLRLNIDCGYGERKTFTEKGFQSLGEGLERLNKLKKARMGLHVEMNDKEFQYICEGIRNMVAIEDIELKFYRCKKAGDRGLKSLSRSLKKLKCLRRIGLEFSGGKVSDEGICGLFEGLEARKESLEVLEVKVISPENITDEGMRVIGTKLKELELLRGLDLQFYGGREILDKGIEYLSQGIKELKGLQDLSLNFFSCDRFGDEGLKSLGEGLGEMLSLEKLTIDISGKRKMSSAGLEGFMKGIKRLKGLKRLNMDLIGLNWIKEKGMEILSDGLKEMSGLQSISLDLAKCDWVDDEGVLKLVDELKGLVWLKKVELGVAFCKKVKKEKTDGLKIRDVEVCIYERAIRNLNGPLLV